MLIWTILLLWVPDGEKQLKQSCTPCHRLEVVTRLRLSRWEWSRELDKMTLMGAKIERRKALLDYLTKNFGNH